MTVQSTHITLRAAERPRETPLPPLKPLQNASSQIHEEDAAPDPKKDALLRNASFTLPYLNQDDYDRQLAERPFEAIVIENRYLRAVFLPELGGRLWELIHKPTGRNLVWTNPVIRFANLAIRNAWFAGGIEWNVSILGHSPFTCAPVFAGLVRMPDGSEALRLWEWERVRGITWQIDVILPEDSPFLYVRPRIVNPNDHDVLMYWWSNVAVPERDDIRVLAPADRAKRHDYNNGLIEYDMPHTEGVDASYPARRESARDMYMLIPPENRPWVASLDGEGAGLVVASSSRSFGRKAFNWGTSAGGQTWQQYLSEPGEAYYEVQAGLTTTQTEYAVMPGGACWEWMEAYGLVQADTDDVHSRDWGQAYEAVQDALDRCLPQERIESMLEQTATMATQPPESVLFAGSGWGALEVDRCRHGGQPTHWTVATPFAPQTMDKLQAPWLALLQDGRLPEWDARRQPPAPMVQPEWHAMLEESAKHTQANHWLTWYQLGIARFGADDRCGAVEAWNRSIDCTPSGWACRNLGMAAWLDDQLDEAVDHYRRAIRLLPDVSSLVVEYLTLLLEADLSAEALQWARSLDRGVLDGRIDLLIAQAALAQDDLATVKSFFDRGVTVSNIREGETATSDLWFAFQERRLSRSNPNMDPDELREYVRRHHPVPNGMDFRPVVDKPSQTVLSERSL